ncbi:MAG: hypothetical protein KA369_13585 [Spirochaetes bacterium]|nr:hypothetical protein [Spirochaetota bacterium]
MAEALARVQENIFQAIRQPVDKIDSPTLSHFCVTFTLPGPVTKGLFKKHITCEDLITAAAGV